ncbi:hypothetical protein FKG94_03295 [Exilibacterium tricleocarpae]|uniref:Uncharacterized protein n=1 Tax=Exilibacterium tricleocarpae TaxID=2591008 RepID=A0A545U6Y0_9GAMM|nr:hypothetical protein [Exilibacterium tricleocarpae]TQV85229.1 hypothetical protein FKG94_03295 [Exilibacterium tricleocarpae]
MQSDKQTDVMQVGRLAMRQEGGNWNAYYALPGTMDNAHLLGSVKMALIIGRPDRKNSFIDLMRDCVADLIEDTTSTRPDWGEPATAPAHEQAGNA